MTKELKFVPQPELWVERRLWEREVEEGMTTRMSICAHTSSDLAKTLTALMIAGIYCEISDFAHMDCGGMIAFVYCNKEEIKPVLMDNPEDYEDQITFIIDPKIFCDETEAMRYVEEEVQAQAELKSGASVN